LYNIKSQPAWQVKIVNAVNTLHCAENISAQHMQKKVLGQLLVMLISCSPNVQFKSCHYLS